MIDFFVCFVSLSKSNKQVKDMGPKIRALNAPACVCVSDTHMRYAQKVNLLVYMS